MLVKLFLFGALFFAIAILPWLFIRQLSMMERALWWFWPWFLLLCAAVAIPIKQWVTP